MWLKGDGWLDGKVWQKEDRAALEIYQWPEWRYCMWLKGDGWLDGKVWQKEDRAALEIYQWPEWRCRMWLKGIVQPFELWDETKLIRSAL